MCCAVAVPVVGCEVPFRWCHTVAFIKTTLAKAAKLTRVRIPRFEKTDEWRQMRAALEKGLKPSEALSVYFAEADMLKYRITNRRTVARYVKKYLAAHKLPYKIKSFQSRAGGFHVQVWAVGKSLR
jgi:hypothetical protein